MIYPQVDIKEWCDTYKIEITDEDKVCVRCGVSTEYTIAVAHKEFRGVQQPPHDCGSQYQRSILRAVGESEKMFRELFNLLPEVQ